MSVMKNSNIPLSSTLNRKLMDASKENALGLAGMLGSTSKDLNLEPSRSNMGSSRYSSFKRTSYYNVTNHSSSPSKSRKQPARLLQGDCAAKFTLTSAAEGFWKA